MTTAIEIRDLVKRYGPTLAVDGVSLSVEEGETFGYLGPNGAGKTTTIRCLLGLIAAVLAGLAALALAAALWWFSRRDLTR